MRGQAGWEVSFPAVPGASAYTVLVSKDEQGKQEMRIRQLTAMLKDAKISEAPEADGVVRPGTVITATIFGDEERFLLGSREIAGGTDLDVYSEQSPLGAAINGMKVGEKGSYPAPNGKTIPVEILAVETFTG